MVCAIERPFAAVYAEVRHEVREALIDTARRRRFISYSDLVARVKAFKLRPDDSRLHALLDEISTAENAAGRGLLTIVVVHRSGDMMPGRGFFELARFHGRDVRNQEKFWSSEVAHVFETWKK
ncbi:MAG: hypothetical protein ABTQ29_06105 [Siculibacillus sp.]